MAGRNSRSGAVPSILHFHTRMPRQVSEDRRGGQGGCKAAERICDLRRNLSEIPSRYLRYTVHQCSPL